jgi:metallo-beta-lactamase class B
VYCFFLLLPNRPWIASPALWLQLDWISDEGYVCWQVLGGLLRQIRALMLLGAAIGMAPLGAAGRVEPIQAQNEAPPPQGFRIIGNIYWVGGEYGSYLITTPQGHILHDTGTNEMHDVIVSNVKKLGFDVKDIKMLISSHAHFDHVQGHVAMKKLTGAQVIALGGDAAALEAGQDNSAGGFRGMVAVHVDRVIKEGDTISLGGVTLRALWVPGHTRGATVWMTTVSEGGKNYSVAFRGGETPNAGVQLIGNPRHPRVIENTKMTLQRMKALQLCWREGRPHNGHSVNLTRQTPC